MENGLSALAQGGNQQSGWQNFLSGLKDFFIGRPEELHQIEQFTPQQLEILQQLLSQGSSMMRDPYKEFEPIAKYAQSQFTRNVVPSLAERFTSMGSNSLSSPSFASQLGAAGSDLAERLAAMRSQYGMQNRSQAMSMLSSGLHPHFQNYQSSSQPGFLQSIAPAAGKIAMHAGLAGLTGGTSAILPALSALI
jgi:hypothetical protein